MRSSGCPQRPRSLTTRRSSMATPYPCTAASQPVADPLPKRIATACATRCGTRTGGKTHSTRRCRRRRRGSFEVLEASTEQRVCVPRRVSGDAFLGFGATANAVRGNGRDQCGLPLSPTRYRPSRQRRTRPASGHARPGPRDVVDLWPRVSAVRVKDAPKRHAEHHDKEAVSAPDRRQRAQATRLGRVP